MTLQCTVCTRARFTADVPDSTSHKQVSCSSADNSCGKVLGAYAGQADQPQLSLSSGPAKASVPLATQRLPSLHLRCVAAHLLRFVNASSVRKLLAIRTGRASAFCRPLDCMHPSRDLCEQHMARWAACHIAFYGDRSWCRPPQPTGKAAADAATEFAHVACPPPRSTLRLRRAGLLANMSAHALPGGNAMQHGDADDGPGMVTALAARSTPKVEASASLRHVIDIDTSGSGSACLLHM